MCGIAGVVGRPPDREALDAALRACAHRGPDDRGAWCDGRAMLGHVRLSVLDLSPCGRQPMGSEDGGVQVVLNGEIYNFAALRAQLEHRHRFSSRTDTEVLVHGYEEWGIEGLLSRLNGMFAFALWDRGREVLHLARDRMGKKPLFYARDDGALAFASTLPALTSLLRGTRPVRPEAVLDFVMLGSIPGEHSILAGVHKLPPAHRAEWRADGMRVHRYWSLSFARQERRTPAEWLERMEAEIGAAVERRLVSDVPVGVFLSGGVDSSLVAAMMAARSARPVVTITAGFDEAGFSEAAHAARVAAHLGTEHHVHVVRPDAAALLPRLVFHAGEPFGDRAVLPTYLLAGAAREHVTVVLTGDGGDECFGGYAAPLVARLAEPYSRMVPLALRRHAPALLSRLERVGGRPGWAARQLRRVAVPAAGRTLRWEIDPLGERGFRGRLQGLLSDSFARQLAGHDPDAYVQRLFDGADGPTAADRALYADLMASLPDLLLVKADVATMAHAVEVRSPLLDTQVVELASRIPAADKVRGLRSKWLLKELAARYVPRDVVFRRKQGFAVPVGAWMRGLLGAPVAGLLLSSEALGRGLFRPQAVRQMVEDHRAGRADHGSRLWLLLQLELWMRMFVDRTLSPTDELRMRPAGSRQ